MTSPILAELTEYKVEISAFLAWFPTTSESRLDQPRLRNITISRSSTDPFFRAGGPAPPVTLGWFSPDEDELNLGDEGATGTLTLSWNEQLTFELEVVLKVGNAQASKRLVIESDTITPFMVNVGPVDDDDLMKFTAATFHGVVTAGPRPLATIAVNMRDVFKG